ncbi:MAG: hypothetical protein OXC94_06890 [Chloroflexi bacterium]|nr:hypothetical protein [Chloroflexota bacterium]
MSTLTERLEQLPAERRRRVEERARALIAEEMSRRDSMGLANSPAPTPHGRDEGSDSGPLS